MTYLQARQNLIRAISLVGMVFKTEGAYNRHLWEAALDLYRGDIDAFGFVDEFVNNIGEQLTRAWNEGAREVGVDPADMTDEDNDYLDNIIANEHEYVLGLAEEIEAARESGATLDEFRTQYRARIDMWSNRYNDVKNEAKLYFGGKTRLEWTLGATEEHCSTCARLNGIVAYAEEWAESGFQPQKPPNDMLECGGWRCDCSLDTTDRRRSPNALDRLLDIAVSGNV